MGLVLRWATYSSMAATNSAMLVNTARRSRLTVISFVPGRLAVDLLEELQPLDVGVALLALADDLSVKHVKRGKQCGRAMARLVVRHRLGARPD